MWRFLHGETANKKLIVKNKKLDLFVSLLLIIAGFVAISVGCLNKKQVQQVNDSTVTIKGNTMTLRDSLSYKTKQ